MTETATHPTVAYVTRHGDEVYGNVYRNGSRLAYTVFPAALLDTREGMLADARNWLAELGYGAGEFVNAPFGSYDRFDYKITVWPTGE
jgi:hypothetical protein